MSLQEKHGPLMRFKDVSRTCCRGRTAIYGDIKKGEFPAPVKIGRRAVAWRTNEVQAWVEARARAA